MNKYPGTLLPQTNEPVEIQKGMLDLLAKINEVASPSVSATATVKNVSANYTFTPTDGILDLFVTTAAATITVTLCGTAGRVVRVWKADSGAGEVKVVGRTLGSTTQTVNGFAAVYVGTQYQHADVYQNGTTCFVIGQYFQPVPGEPSLGTPHPAPLNGSNLRQIYTGTPAVTASTTGVDVSAYVPAGTKEIFVEGSIKVGSNTVAQLCASKTSTANYDNGIWTVQGYGGAAFMYFPFSGPIKLDANRKFWIYLTNAAILAVDMYIVDYNI